MTIYIPFNPSSLENSQEQITLDGTSYNAIIRWNMYGQRYYLFLYDTQGNRIVCTALIASPDNYSINILAGYFTSPFIYRASSATFEIG